jgi:hypothetical protein
MLLQTTNEGSKKPQVIGRRTGNGEQLMNDRNTQLKGCVKWALKLREACSAKEEGYEAEKPHPYTFPLSTAIGHQSFNSKELKESSVHVHATALVPVACLSKTPKITSENIKGLATIICRETSFKAAFPISPACGRL